MNARRFVAVVCMIGGLGLMSIPAQAQGASITVEPSVVPTDAGDVTVEVRGERFSMAGFVLLCPEVSGDVEAALEDPSGRCDLDRLTPYDPTDGSWTAAVTLTVTPDIVASGGLVLVATDPAGADVAAITVMVTDAVAEDEPLPTTGVGSAVTALGGINMVAFGGVLMISDRRRNTATTT